MVGRGTLGERMEGNVVGNFCLGDMVQEIIELGVVGALGNVPLRFIGIRWPNDFFFFHKRGCRTGGCG